MPSQRVASIESAVELFQKAVNEGNNDNNSDLDTGGASPQTRDVSVQSIKRITEILREAYANEMSGGDLSALVRRACDAEEKILDWAYGMDEGGFDFFPLYSGNVVKDLSRDEMFGSPGAFKSTLAVIHLRTSMTPATANFIFELVVAGILQDAPAHKIEEGPCSHVRRYRKLQRLNI